MFHALFLQSVHEYSCSESVNLDLLHFTRVLYHYHHHSFSDTLKKFRVSVGFNSLKKRLCESLIKECLVNGKSKGGNGHKWRTMTSLVIIITKNNKENANKHST